MRKAVSVIFLEHQRVIGRAEEFVLVLFLEVELCMDSQLRQERTILEDRRSCSHLVAPLEPVQTRRGRARPSAVG